MEVEYAPIHRLDIAKPAIQEIVAMLEDHIPMAKTTRAAEGNLMHPVGRQDPFPCCEFGSTLWDFSGPSSMGSFGGAYCGYIGWVALP